MGVELLLRIVGDDAGSGENGRAGTQMTNDLRQLFAALAIQRGLVSPQQIESLLKRGDETQPLDAQLVRAGFVSVSERLELLSEMDSQVLAADGDVRSAIRSACGQSAEVSEFISIYETSVKSSKDSLLATDDGEDSFQETMVRPESSASYERAEAASGSDKESDDGSEESSGDESFSETVISHKPTDTDDGTKVNLSSPFDGTLIYQAGGPSDKDSAAQKKSTDSGQIDASESDPGETIDRKPTYHSRYTLTQVYGEGGLGQVWLATDPALKREIALKRIRPGKDGSRDAQLRLIKEAQITGQLEHPNIIPVYELEQADDNGLPFYTMKFMRGQTLEDHIKAYHKKRKKGEAGPLDLVNLLNAFIDVCYAMAYAGARGIVHRDLKPQNIMLGDFGEVLVLDWGLAKKVGQPDDLSENREVKLASLVDVTETHAGCVVGTPAFMAPEQAAGRNEIVDARTAFTDSGPCCSAF